MRKLFREKKNGKFSNDYLLLFNDQKLVRVHYFAVIVTDMQFLELFIYES